MTEPTQQDLKACPFCGGKGVIEKSSYRVDHEWAECVRAVLRSEYKHKHWSDK